jgi:hypothetical protein
MATSTVSSRGRPAQVTVTVRGPVLVTSALCHCADMPSPGKPEAASTRLPDPSLTSAVTRWSVALRSATDTAPDGAFDGCAEGTGAGVTDGPDDGLTTGVADGPSEAIGPAAAAGREMANPTAMAATATAPRARATAGWIWPRLEG